MDEDSEGMDETQVWRNQWRTAADAVDRAYRGYKGALNTLVQLQPTNRNYRRQKVALDREIEGWAMVRKIGESLLKDVP